MQTLLDIINDNFSPNIAKKTQKNDGEGKSDIFLKLLNSLNTENTDKPQISDILNLKEINNINNEIDLNITKKVDPKNLFEASNFLQILSLLEVLNGGKINKFPILNSKMTEFFSVEKNVLEIKSAKNILELVKISKKFDLGLEKISITKDLTNKFEKEFKELAKKNFFKIENNLKFDEITKSKINQMAKIDPKKDDANLPKLLANLDNKNTKSEITTDKIIKSKNENDLNIENKIIDKKTDLNLQNQKSTNEKILQSLQKENEVNSDLNIQTTKNTNEKKQEITNEKIQQLPQKENEIKSQNKIDKKMPFEEILKDKNLNNESKFDKIVKSDEIINKISQKIPENTHKIEIPQDKNIDKKPQENNQIKQNIQKEDMLKTALNPSMQTDKEQNKKDDNQQSQNKNSSDELNLIVKDIVKNAQNQMKNIEVKRTFESFATTLKDQIENYKPPIMRVNMVLNPEKLGEVEITIINRGNNLHINFNSTSQAMSLFLQNQAEFKASLVNMGFSELQMNFSDQNQNKNQEQSSKKFRYTKNDNELQDEEMEHNLLEIVVPRYI
ncbi:flagellar hook-length control protein FliK [Campylobacter sp. RM12327]|uniref:flagellar hook-length control protein FliK n=1 Tax=Campylobacter sputorum TaxID=206 RepID=UPI000B7996B4|nr:MULTISPECIES: flagellar hook-length control protein FliK [Campylobacter]ASM39438.1 flagellar hook-length control protein [Campylobacter sputorum]MBE7358905.1 flagellar hook-length control protein FliK [Campylobacter sp. RM11302]MBF6670004.1 flagellar hook-length control protein FliK [Campylobacter sp. RM12327]MBF6674228.1 flagellar hook-length control protein FliK [Campylobacter sp. RM13538]MBF6676653.1 flagellar hook-length control protein FliK [Campylobacter sp. RM12321]